MNQNRNRKRNRRMILRGLRDGLPIGLGYFAVAFSLGIIARNVGLSPFQGFVASFLNHASAGEYALYTQISAGAAMWELAGVILVTNIRYLLMSTALNQRILSETSTVRRMAAGFCITDEIFGLGIAFTGSLSILYLGTAFLLADLMWSAGTMIGIIVGNILPQNIINAMSVAIFGMFLAIIIPPSRKNRVVAGIVAVSFAGSFAMDRLVSTDAIPEGIRVILLTVTVAAAAAALFPVPEKTEDQEGGT